VTDASIAVLYWAFLHGVLVGLLLGWTTDPLQWGLMAGSGFVALLLALGILAYRTPRSRLVPELSVATILFAFGIGSALSGVAFGLWLILIGAGAAALGLAGMVRELGAERTEME
jgi:hypothetical protein